MISTFGATPEQAERFIELYKKGPLRAAAEEAGINIIQATMIARHLGILAKSQAASFTGWKIKAMRTYEKD